MTFSEVCFLLITIFLYRRSSWVIWAKKMKFFNFKFVFWFNRFFSPYFYLL